MDEIIHIDNYFITLLFLSQNPQPHTAIQIYRRTHANLQDLDEKDAAEGWQSFLNEIDVLIQQERIQKVSEIDNEPLYTVTEKGFTSF